MATSTYLDFRPEVRLQQTLSISADGTQVAFADDALGRYYVAIASVADGEVRRLPLAHDQSVRRVAWRPDGKALAFLADSGGSERWQVYTTDLDSPEPTALTDNPSAQFATSAGAPYSPDGHYLAFTGNDRLPHAQDVLVTDLTTNETRRVHTTDGWLFTGCWSPDGQRLSVVEHVEPSTHHVVHIASPTGEPAVRLTPPDMIGTFHLGSWLPDGSGFLVRSNLGRDFVGLAVMDAATGELSWLDAPDWDVEQVALSGDGRVLAWLVNVDGMSVLRLRDLHTGADLPAPALPVGDAREMCMSDDGGTVAMLITTPTQPTGILIVDVPSGRTRFLIQPNLSGAPREALVEPALIRYRSGDGTQIPAFEYRPNVDRPAGVVIAIHGGPDAQERPAYMYDGLYQYLASKGVGVLAPNFRGSTGYGLRYQQRLNRDWGGVDLMDFAAAVEYLRSRDWVDPERIGLYGGSYGGYGVLSCLAMRPDLNWAAAVNVCGISNLMTVARTSPAFWRPRILTMIGDPDTQADHLLSRSPVTHADAIRAPLLVIQGANDTRVPRDESDQIVERLRACGVDVHYDVYEDEGHIFTKRDNQIRARADSAEFLIAHLGQ
jgi:dipeptidyl aminopeptidase/acylaminoacyl peptidase